MHPPWYAPLYAITMIPSTTSYFSSFGACSMYGGPKRVARMQFLSETYETLRTEAARGTGDHLVAFASLAGCPVNLYPEFSQLIRRQLAGEPIAGPPVFGALLDRLETAIASDSNLGSACKLN